MRRLAPGSVSWLFRHELRLRWRSLSWYWALLPVTVISLGFTLILAIRRSGFQWDAPPSPQIITYVTIGLLIQLTFMTSNVIATGLKLLNGNENLDLLISSPLGSRRIFSVQAIITALSQFASNALPVGGLTILLALFAGPTWLGLIPVLLALSLLSTGIGLVLTFGLIRLLGPTRTVVLTQIISSSINALVFILYQYSNHALNQYAEFNIDSVLNKAIATQIKPGIIRTAEPIETADIEGWWFLPIRAAMGSTLDTILLLMISGLILYGTILLAHHWYFLGIQNLKIITQTKPRTRRTRFQSGPIRALILKDLRLIARDASFISSTILHLIYTIPAIVVLAGIGSDQGPNSQRAIPISAVLLVGNITNRIARAIVWLDNDLRLLELTPIHPHIRTIKLLTAVTPSVLLTLPLALFGLWLPGPPTWTVMLMLIGSGLSFGITAVWVLHRGEDSSRTRASEQDLELLSNILLALLLIDWIGMIIWFSMGVWMAWVCLAIAFLIPTVVVAVMGRKS